MAEGRRVTIEANTLQDPAIFRPRTYARTPLQQFLEQLYAERADPVSVAYTYRVFRRAHPQIDTREGVEFVGYQMAQMKDYPGSTEMLKMNAADYPTSATARYGLGRAYKAAGDFESAKREFERALQIDPQFKKAAEGLNALR